jgi:hypothetical protein
MGLSASGQSRINRAMDTPTAASTPADRRLSSGQLTGLLGLALLAIGLAFAFDSADAPHWFALFKWIHVSVAVFWVGGGILLTVLGLKVEHSDDPN